jgi:hypothetical protein
MEKITWVPSIHFDPAAPAWIQTIPIGVLLVVLLFVVATGILCLGSGKKHDKKPPEGPKSPRGTWRGAGARGQ